MNRRSISLAVSVFAVAWTDVVAAAEKAEAHGPASISTLFLPLVNFAIFAFVIQRYAWPALRGALVDRRKTVERDLAEADRARTEAQALLADIETRRAGVAAEGERMLREMRQEAEHERAALVDAAKKSADRIRADARLLGEQEGDRAARSIREEVAAKVVANVARVLRERVGPEDEARFVDEFVATAEQAPR
jgi:F-type H+-transporting ATPase subunit b